MSKHKENFMEPLSALGVAIIVSLIFSSVVDSTLVNTLRTALASSLFGGFAALLVVGYQISRAQPAR